MNKSMPLIILMVMVTLLFISWGNVAKYNSNVKAKFDNHMKAAQEYEAKLIYIDAVKEYESALAVDDDNYELAVKIMNLYQKLNKPEEYLLACEKAKKIDPKQPEMHFVLIDYYWNLADYETAYTYLKDAKKYFPENEEIQDKIMQLKGMYTLSGVSFQQFKGWCFVEGDNNGSAVISVEDKYGILNGNNTTLVPCAFEETGPVIGGLIPIKVNGEYYYADSSGNRKVVPDTPAEYLGPFNNGYAVSRADGVYGFIDNEGEGYHFEFEEAGSFSNNVAPVKIDGKWLLIDTDFKVVKGLVFEDILMDEYGFCSVYGVFFGKTNGKYHLYDRKGNNLSAAHCDGFEDAKLFVSNQPAAVKMNGKWGYVNINGTIAIEPKYEDADSFNFGYGPFMENGKWGCSSLDGTRWIEPTFDHLTAFARNGYALSEVDGVKKFVKLKFYN